MLLVYDWPFLHTKKHYFSLQFMTQFSATDYYISSFTAPQLHSCPSLTCKIFCLAGIAAWSSGIEYKEHEEFNILLASVDRHW